MSRSYKKKPYGRMVCVKEGNVRSIKRLVNRTYRHKLNAGEYDKDARHLTAHKIEQDSAWKYELKKYYWHTDTMDSEYFKKFIRKK